MTTSTLTKTAAGVLLALTQQATAVVTLGSAVDVSTKAYGQVFIKVGRTVATALTNELKFRLEASSQSSGNDEWVPIWEGTTVKGKTASISSTVNDASFNAGDTTVTVTSAASMVAGDVIYFRETGTPANSEWCRIVSISSNTLTLEEATTRNHTNSINVATQAEEISFQVNLLAVIRLRLVVDSASSASGQTVDVLAWINTMDSVTTA